MGNHPKALLLKLPVQVARHVLAHMTSRGSGTVPGVNESTCPRCEHRETAHEYVCQECPRQGLPVCAWEPPERPQEPETERAG